MPVNTTTNQVAASWQKGMAGASTKYKAGVSRVTVAPGQQAAAAKDRWLSGVQAAVTTFARRSMAVSLGDWQAAAATKGAARLASGAAAAQPKFQAAMAKLLPVITSVVKSLPAKGARGSETNINRSSEFQRRMHAARQSGQA